MPLAALPLAALRLAALPLACLLGASSVTCPVANMLCQSRPNASGLATGRRMNSSATRCATSSVYCAGGDFISQELGPKSEPLMPLSRASLQNRTASITMPALLGLSWTSSLSSMLRGTSPNDFPSRRMNAHLRSLSQGT